MLSMKKVYVGMSGGVDSSLTAALLVEQGYDVTGVYMKNWTQDLPGMKCPWANDLADAKRVAVQLNIPFKVFDFQTEYKQKVVDYMIAEYEKGRTPNPDIMCNQEIKFKLFLETALADGAEMIATGHYARVENCHSGLDNARRRVKSESVSVFRDDDALSLDPESSERIVNIDDEKVRKICAENSIELKKITPIEIGFTNKVYKINDDLILKIYRSKTSFINEKSILQSDFDIKKPKLIAANPDENYIIMEFINGVSLGQIWHKASETQRESLIKQISENLKKINQIPVKFFANCGKNWQEILNEDLKDHWQFLREKNVFNDDQISRAEKFWKENRQLFENENPVPVFWDVHFDNFIVDENFNLLSQIDFEEIWLAARDYPLFMLEKMIHEPKLLLSENDEKFADKKDYKNLKKYYQKHYPEMFDFRNLDRRVQVYHFMDMLHLLKKYPADKVFVSATFENTLFNDFDVNSIRRESDDNPDSNSAKLLRARDEMKDQTYFLYRVTEEALSKTLFPIGDFSSKEEVREAAEKRGLTTARKKDSQGICFVGEVGVRDFLSQFVETKPGNIIEQETGQILGQHDGAIFYTLGQRHGLNIGGGLPYYVVGKSMEKNEVYVSKNLNASEFFRAEIELDDVHWINDAPLPNKKYLARVRHRGQLIECEIFGGIVHLSEPQRAIASGQSIVIYDDEICLGGGIVK